jgi:adenylate kinase
VFCAQVVGERLREGRLRGEKGFILDGFPRKASQAAGLDALAEVQLAVNLQMREEVRTALCSLGLCALSQARH